MTPTLSEINYEEPGKILFVSNTPIYLVDRLKESTAVLFIARAFDSNAIFHELSQSLRTDVHTTADEARPYTLLVALYLKQARQEIEQTESSDVSRFSWFDYIRRYLLMTMKPPVAAHEIAYSPVLPALPDSGSPTPFVLVEEKVQ
jgi:hypothetical protein